MKAAWIAAVAAGAMVACSGGPEKERVGRRFQTMAQCLDFIQQDTGDTLQVITDKPGDVSGTTHRDRLFFRCEARATGTEGLILEGRWDRLKQ